MPTFQFRTRDGRTHPVQAHRVRADDRFVYAEVCTTGASPPWVTVLRLPRADVTAVRRRLEQPGGGHRWIDPLLQTDRGLRPLNDLPPARPGRRERNDLP
jgi:hypothetical protein